MSDYFTKWVEAGPMADQKAETVARAFIDCVVSRHGVPVKLLTDQGRNFESQLMKEVFKLLGVHKLRTSPYHDQQTDGSTEMPKTRLIVLNYCAELEITLKEVHATVAEKIKKAQTQQQTQNYDARNTAHQTEIPRPGDIVWLHSTVIPKGRSRKFQKPWIGPYVILRCQGRLNYVIRPKSGKERSWCVHRNRLKLVQNQTEDINEQDMSSPLSTKRENTQEQRVAKSTIVHKEVEATNMVPQGDLPVSADHLI
ncbi:Retrovirus-related Pol poly from transposon, partial [Paramuricea clavata]